MNTMTKIEWKSTRRGWRSWPLCSSDRLSIASPRSRHSPLLVVYVCQGWIVIMIMIKGRRRRRMVICMMTILSTCLCVQTLVIIIIITIKLLSSLSLIIYQVVQEYERAVIFRLGRLVKVWFNVNLIWFLYSYWLILMSFSLHARWSSYHFQGGARGPGIFFIVPCIDSYKKVIFF